MRTASRSRLRHHQTPLGSIFKSISGGFLSCCNRLWWFASLLCLHFFNPEKSDVVSLAVVAGTSKGPKFWFMVVKTTSASLTVVVGLFLLMDVQISFVCVNTQKLEMGFVFFDVVVFKMHLELRFLTP